MKNHGQRIVAQTLLLLKSNYYLLYLNRRSTILAKQMRFMPSAIQKMVLLFLCSFFLLLLLAFQGCGLTTARPKLELSMATAALLAAKDAKANTLAPNLYRKAEVYLLKARSSYKRKYFNKAKQFALLSKQFSEKAEFVAVRQSSVQ